MAVQLVTTVKNFIGLSSDSKPAAAPVGSFFHETDTGNDFLWDGSSWGEKGGGSATAETAAITAQNTFCDGISPDSKNGYLNISISNTFVATVFLQRSFDAGVNYFDVDSWTGKIETSLTDTEPGVLYRLGVKTGGYTSGTADVRLSR